jgi:uncharacterized protein YoxC
MATLVHADVFFFVTTVMVVVVGIALTVALIYLASALRQVRIVMQEVKEEAVLMRRDIEQFRDNVRRGEWKLKTLADAAIGLFKWKKSKKK